MAKKQNIIIAKSGRPTAVINSSVCVINQEVINSGKFGTICRAVNGIFRILKEELLDIST